MYMALAVALDVRFIRINHVTYVIGQLCTCVLDYLCSRPTVVSDYLLMHVICRLIINMQNVCVAGFTS